MTSPEKFDDIRPYRDDEIPSAMRRIALSPIFPVFANFLYPGEPVDEVIRRVSSYKTTYEFQRGAMHDANDRIIASSITDFSCCGLEHLDRDKAYLFISNHRDIMLDAALLQNCLVDAGFDTSEITFGANLMTNQLVIDIGKSNKMFRVERPGLNMREFYRASKHLSEYIRHTITERGQSVWIAQRNGRTKDGNDRTDQGVVKMFCMSHEDDKLSALTELHIVPVSVSYEWETCDILKTLELYESGLSPYTKKPGEDLTSIVTGIIQDKGRVHFEVCEPIDEEELAALDALTANRYHHAVAELIDARIHASYRLYPNNFIAHDLLYASSRFRSRYTPAQKAAFEDRLHLLDRYDSYDLAQLREIFLGIYANSVDNRFGRSLSGSIFDSSQARSSSSLQ